MEKNGKYKIIIVLILIVCLFAFTLFTNNEEERVRIRVISNSNDINDITQKEEVKSIVLSVIDAFDTTEEIKRKLPILKEKLDDYSNMKRVLITVELGVTNFPPKKLKEKIIPGGEYQTLLITIGEGKGNNYWTLLYPEYYGITFEEVYSGEVEIKSYFYELIK